PPPARSGSPPPAAARKPTPPSSATPPAPAPASASPAGAPRAPAGPPGWPGAARRTAAGTRALPRPGRARRSTRARCAAWPPPKRGLLIMAGSAPCRQTTSVYDRGGIHPSPLSGGTMSVELDDLTRLRRRDRGVEDEAWIEDLLGSAPFGVLATVHDG